MKKSLFILLALICFKQSIAQETFPTNGAKYTSNTILAFTEATIYSDYKTELKNATLLIQNDKILDIGTSVVIPKNAIIRSLKGKTIYPSFIDLHSNYGMPEIKKQAHSDSPIYISSNSGPNYWNQAIHPEYNSYSEFKNKDKDAEEYRNLGFGTVLAHQPDGIAQGTGTLVFLGNEIENKSIYKTQASAHFSFDKGSSPLEYPSSQMGSIALLRQSFYDADWYKKTTNKSEINASLEALNNTQKLPQFFDINDKLEILRVAKIGKEFNQNYIIKGNGDEYQRLEEIKNTQLKLIIPLNFPSAYDVSDPFDAQLVQLSQMKHWELAPKNAAFLSEKNIEFSITSSDLKERKAFLTNLRMSVKYGLSKENALKSLTYNPAQFLNIYSELGSLEKGKIANFIICSGDIFEDKTVINENWIQGKKYSINAISEYDLIGKFDLKILDSIYNIILSDKDNSIIIDSSTKIKIKIVQENNLVSLSFAFSDSTESYFLSGWIENQNIKGKGTKQNGEKISWEAIFREKLDEKIDTAKEEKLDLGEIVYPFIGYGNKKIPTHEEVLFKNTTVWTNEIEGVLQNTDVLIKDGKIVRIGKDLSSPTAKIIDATNLHLTAGIIDEHSHIAISKGVNESGQASTAEVSIADVINSEDINIYRQLAGGVTAAQLLHGSANPIGGQSAIIKLRWGKSPEEMKIENADGFIKFALGENVKQSNWGDRNTTRFPQTRMGVEQVYFDHFIRAKEYQEQWTKFNSLSKKQKLNSELPRKDLELDVLSEILNNKRFITCHSYQQGEINMLMKVADSMKFRINTFTHILEGYKVADKMKTHGVGASTFSDWWAYKYEVNDAIPYNGAILNKVGIVTAYNSDDAEMGRRLNQEAAKAVKYGNVSEEEAWKFVTLNPAKLLHLDDKMGSIKIGKDADLVLWTDHPLSVYAQVKQTYVDGICYFDSEKEKEKQIEIQQERNRLIQKMVGEKKAGKPVQKATPKQQILYHCDSE